MDKPIDTLMFSILGLSDAEDIKSFSVGVRGDLLGQDDIGEFELHFQKMRSDDQVSLLEAVLYQSAHLIAQGNSDKRNELIKEFKERF